MNLIGKYAGRFDAELNIIKHVQLLGSLFVVFTLVFTLKEIVLYKENLNIRVFEYF